MKVLLLTHSLRYGGAARQLTLLAAALANSRIEPRVCVLGPAWPWAQALRTRGVPCDCLEWRRLFDLQVLPHLRSVVRSFRPDVVHVWGLPALRGLLAAGFPLRPPVIVSAPLPAGRFRSRLNWLDRLLLRRAAWVTAAGPAEAERLCRLGLPADRIVQVPPGVALAEEEVVTRHSLGLPEGARVLAGVGPLELSKGFRDAIWALDVLHYVCSDVHLVLIGRGRDRPRLEHFARALDVTRHVHFPGERADVPALLALAEVVWVPSWAEGGRNAALEAMAARRPVVASRLPGLAEIVRDGETGLLFAPGDPSGLARQTRLLLDDPSRCKALGEAGRRRVQEHFSVARLAENFARLYE